MILSQLTAVALHSWSGCTLQWSVGRGLLHLFDDVMQEDEEGTGGARTFKT